MQKLTVLVLAAMIVTIFATTAGAQGFLRNASDSFEYKFSPEETDEFGQPAHSLLFKRIMADVASGDVKDLKTFIDVTGDESLEKAYRYAVSEGQAEVVKTIDEALKSRNPYLFRAPDSLREELIVRMMAEQKELKSNDAKDIQRNVTDDAMITLLLSLGARGDRTVRYHGPTRLAYDGYVISLVEWAVKIEKSGDKHLCPIAKTVPGTEDGLRILRKARRDTDRFGAQEGAAESIKAVIDPQIARIIEALQLAGVEKDLSEDQGVSVNYR
jgi:hypothetical protein